MATDLVTTLGDALRFMADRVSWVDETEKKVFTDLVDELEKLVAPAPSVAAPVDETVPVPAPPPVTPSEPVPAPTNPAAQ